MSDHQYDSGRSDYGRGQMTLDFAVGMGVFLVTVIFVISYAPTMFDPFADGAETGLAVADRVATTLSGDLLVGSTAEPGVLSTGCVADFFEGADGEDTFDAECSTDADVSELDEALAVDGRRVNVTVHDPDDTSSEPSPATITVDGTDIELTRSNTESIPGDAAIAARIVSIDTEQYRLTVRVW